MILPISGGKLGKLHPENCFEIVEITADKPTKAPPKLRIWTSESSKYWSDHFLNPPVGCEVCAPKTDLGGGGWKFIPGTPFVSYFFRQLETPKTSNYCLKNRAQTAFQVSICQDILVDFCPCRRSSCRILRSMAVPSRDALAPSGKEQNRRLWLMGVRLSKGMLKGNVAVIWYWYVLNYVSIFSVHDIFGMISIDYVCVYTFMYIIFNMFKIDYLAWFW